MEGKGKRFLHSDADDEREYDEDSPVNGGPPVNGGVPVNEDFKDDKSSGGEEMRDETDGAMAQALMVAAAFEKASARDVSGGERRRGPCKKALTLALSLVAVSLFTLFGAALDSMVGGRGDVFEAKREALSGLLALANATLE